MRSPAADTVLLATFDGFPEGEPDGHRLVEAFAERGVTARWVVWDDKTVDWAEGLVAVRATWDYDTRLAEFLDWSREIPRLLNGSTVFEWNTDKTYLTRLLDAGLPVVPTLVATTDNLADVAATWATSVVKPTVGAGGRGVRIIEAGQLEAYDAGEGPWLVQPLLESVRTEGETSVFVFGGRATSQVRKIPGAGSILVHEHLGGTYDAVPLDAEATDLAVRAVEAGESLLERPLTYARVDMMRLDDGTLALSELEVIEPGLYLDVVPENAGAFADAVLAVL
jgi:glutathione synthase/RimK-type ligase-like ATP-grasp enzyme